MSTEKKPSAKPESALSFDEWKAAGEGILAETKARFGPQWEELRDEDRGSVERAVRELAKLHALETLGRPVDPERVKLLKATIGNWTMVGKIEGARAAEHVWAAVQEYLKKAGKVGLSILGQLAAEALKGLVAGAKDKKDR